VEESQGGWTTQGYNSHLSGIYTRNSFAIPISSSQLITRGVATTSLCAVQRAVALVLLLVQSGKVGHGLRGLRGGVGRRGHSISVEGAERSG
jgi:hypothetical protein